MVGHGSKLSGSSDALNLVLVGLQKKEPATFFQAAFLEIRPPSIPEAIELCVNQGADEVIVIPYFVQAGKHVVQDIPKIVSEAKIKYPDRHIYLTDYLSFDERIISIVEDRIYRAREALKAV